MTGVLLSLFKFSCSLLVAFRSLLLASNVMRCDYNMRKSKQRYISICTVHTTHILPRTLPLFLAVHTRIDDLALAVTTDWLRYEAKLALAPYRLVFLVFSALSEFVVPLPQVSKRAKRL